MRPMLASRGESVPRGPEWLHEVKWDGMRVLARVEDGALTLWSRNENDVTVSFPELSVLADAIGRNAVLDGEVVAMLGGIPTFGALADRMHVKGRLRAAVLAESNPVTLLVFDVLSVDGRDLTGEPLAKRREVLEALDLNGPRWQTPPTYDDGVALLEATTAQGLEGVVSKKRSSRYYPGRRTNDWVKLPNRPTTSYVVGGWRYETDSTTRLGAVLVGSCEEPGVVYRGRVGSGIAGKEGPRLLEVLAPLVVDACPFVTEVPRVDSKGTVWVRPQTIVDVTSLGTTPQGRLRQPAYVGLRPDLTPADITSEGGDADG